MRPDRTQPDAYLRSPEAISRRYDAVRRLIDAIAALEFLADPTPGHPVAVTLAARGHNQGDGIVTTDHAAFPGYASDTRRWEGRLGAAISKVSTIATEIESMAGETYSSRPGRRCGRSDCGAKGRRQDPDARFCGHCGHPFKKEE